MNQMIAFCGLDCFQCDAYKATVANDEPARVKIAAQWSEAYSFPFKASDINCHGCLATDGVQIGHCAQCEIRRCGVEKGVENCGRCGDFACGKLTAFIAQIPGAKERLEAERARA